MTIRPDRPNQACISTDPNYPGVCTTHEFHKEGSAFVTRESRTRFIAAQDMWECHVTINGEGLMAYIAVEHLEAAE